MERDELGPREVKDPGCALEDPAPLQAPPELHDEPAALVDRAVEAMSGLFAPPGVRAHATQLIDEPVPRIDPPQPLGEGLREPVGEPAERGGSRQGGERARLLPFASFDLATLDRERVAALAGSDELAQRRERERGVLVPSRELELVVVLRHVARAVEKRRQLRGEALGPRRRLEARHDLVRWALRDDLRDPGIVERGRRERPQLEDRDGRADAGEAGDQVPERDAVVLGEPAVHPVHHGPQIVLRLGGHEACPEREAVGPVAEVDGTLHGLEEIILRDRGRVHLLERRLLGEERFAVRLGLAPHALVPALDAEEDRQAAEDRRRGEPRHSAAPFVANGEPDRLVEGALHESRERLHDALHRPHVPVALPEERAAPVHDAAPGHHSEPHEERLHLRAEAARGERERDR